MKKTFGKMCAAMICMTLVFGTLSASAKNAKSTSSEKPAKEKKAKKIKKVKFDEEAYKSAIASGDYETALGMLASLKELGVDKLLDKGMLQHYTGDYEGAAATMEDASNAIGEFYAASLRDDGSEKADGGAVLSELASPYKGNIYEFLLVDALNALNYAKQEGKTGDAYSCVVRVGDKQRTYMSKYGNIALADEKTDNAAINNALGQLGIKENPFSIIPGKPTAANIYKTSALADYLQIVLASQNGSEIDDFIVRELNSAASGVDTGAANIPSSQGRIEVLALAGKIAQRVEHVDTSIPLPITGVAGMSFKYVWPVYQGNSNSVPTVKKITLNNGISKNAVLLEDFDKDVENDVACNARKAAQRSIARSTITKATAAASVEAAIKQAKNDLLRNAAIIAAPKSLEALDLKERADIRQGIALPSKAYCAGFNVAPGTYSVTVEYSDGKSETIENVEVKAGRAVLVESFN